MPLSLTQNPTPTRSHPQPHFVIRVIILVTSTLHPNQPLPLGNTEENRTHLQMLLEVALADENFTKQENQFLEHIAKQLGIELEDVVHQYFDPNNITLPKQEPKVFAFFHRLILMAIVDGEIDPKERGLLLEFGIRMGLNPSAVLEVIDYSVAHGPKAVPTEVVNIFYRYQS